MDETVSGLSFAAAFRRVWSKYFVLRGRATRSEYWYYVLFYWLFGIVMGLVHTQVNPNNETSIAAAAFGAGLVVLIPLVTALVRRLHDTNRHGAWVFIWLIPVVGTIVLLVFTLQKSDPAENRYGPAPVPAR